MQSGLPRPVRAEALEAAGCSAVGRIPAQVRWQDGCLRHRRGASKDRRSLWRFPFAFRQPRPVISISKPHLGVDGFDHAVVAIFEAQPSEAGGCNGQVSLLAKGE